MGNNKYNPVGWFEIYVQDIETARKFYEDVFRVKLEDMADPTSGDDSNMKNGSLPHGGGW